MMRFFIRCMDLAADEGLSLVLGNWQGVKEGLEGELNGGRWDDFLKALAAYSNLMYLGWHEYFTGILPAGSCGLSEGLLIQPGAFPQRDWPTQKEFLEKSALHTDIGRLLWVHERARRIGAWPIRTLQTEVG